MEEETSCKVFNKDWLKIIGLLLLVGLGLLYWLVSRQAQPEVLPLAEEPTKDWQVYTGLGLTMKYPSDWKILAKEEDSLVTLTDLPSGGGSMTVRVERNLTLEFLTEESSEEVTLGGFPAMRTEVKEGEKEVEQTIFMERGETTYEINLRADKNLRKKYRDLFNLMLGTLQFTD